MLDTVDRPQPFRIQAHDRIDRFYHRTFPWWKRGLDIFGAALCLVFLSPLMLAIAVLIRTVSPGPALFRQTRVGVGGRHFEFYKFRTMHPDVDTTAHRNYLAELIQSGDGEDTGQTMIKKESRDRIIPFGGLLRKSCLDELPQLINVLQGHMSLVGPRPPIPYEVEVYYRWHNGRFDCLPGMTGLWQVSGKNKLTFKEMVRLDIQYARHCSLWLDIKILIKTPYTILMQVLKGMGHTSPDVKGV